MALRRAAVRLHILYRQGGRLSMDGLETDDNAITRAKRDSQQAARLHSALVHMRTLLQVLPDSAHLQWYRSLVNTEMHRADST